MKINNFDDLTKYITKYKDNAKKMSKIKKNFKEYLELCNSENIMLFINQVKKIPEMGTILYYNSDFICRKFGFKIILEMTKAMDFKNRFAYIHEIYENIRLKYYTIDEFIDDLLKYNQTDYICENMNQIVDSANVNTLTNQGLLKKLKLLDDKKFSEIHSSIVCKMTRIKPEFLLFK